MRTDYINYCRSEHAESSSNILSDIIIDDTLSPTDMFAFTVVTVAFLLINTSLYTLVNFTCEGTGSDLFWTAQNNLLTDPSNQYREISVTTNNISVDVWSSVLTIRALPINDGIDVECTIIDQNFDFVSKETTLTVQG